MVFAALVPTLAKAVVNCRLTVMTSELPEVWIDDPLPLSVHWELETLPASPGVMEPADPVPASLVSPTVFS